MAFGNVTVPSFERANLEREDVRRLVEVTEVYVDEECERIYPRQRSGVAQVRLKDGRVLEERVLDPKGEGGNPMSDADLADKFAANSAPLIGDTRSRALLEAVMTLAPGGSLAPLFHWS